MPKGIKGFLKGYTPWNKGKSLPELIRIKIGLANIGGNSGSFKKGNHYSPDTEFKIGENLGINNVNWKGGKPKCKDCKSILSYQNKTGYCRKCYDKIKPLPKSILKKGNIPWNKGLGGEPKYPYSFNNTLKEFIRNKYFRKCQLCGVPEMECRRKLDIHHIDYDKKNIDINNLIPLCANCHTKTNCNKKDYWKNYLQSKVVIWEAR